MMILDLRTQQLTIDELFHAAASEAVQVIAKDGTIFVLEPADAGPGNTALSDLRIASHKVCNARRHRNP